MKHLIIFFILTLVFGTSSFASQAKETREYRSVKLAAYAHYCGMSNVTQKLFEFFGQTRAYKTGYSQHYIWTSNNTPSLSSKCDEGLRRKAPSLFLLSLVPQIWQMRHIALRQLSSSLDRLE